MSRTASWAMLALAAALCAAGCSRKLDTHKLEKHITEELEKKSGVAPDEVDCPDDVTEKKGDTFECTAKADDGSKATIKVEMRGDGDITWMVTDTGGGKKTAKGKKSKGEDQPTNEPEDEPEDEPADEPAEDAPSEDEL